LGTVFLHDGEQSDLVKPILKSQAVAVASFRVSLVLAKRKKPFTDREMMKEAFLEAGDSLFSSFKNKSEIISAIRHTTLVC
jgi:hypothetical protein